MRAIGAAALVLVALLAFPAGVFGVVALQNATGWPRERAGAPLAPPWVGEPARLTPWRPAGKLTVLQGPGPMEAEMK